MLRNRLTRSGGLLMAAAVWLSGCAAGAEGGGTPSPGVQASADPQMSGTITVVTNRTDMIDTKYKEYAQRFHQRYPSVQVQFEALRDYDKNIKIRLASGETPDVLLIPSVPSADLGKFFAPLGDLNLPGELYFQDFKVYKGETYGIPSGVAVSGVLYNRRAFELAGIKELPATLDAFYAVCGKLKESGVIPLASNFKDRWPLQVWTNDVAVMIGGEGRIKNDLAESDQPFVPGNPYVSAMTIVKTLNDRGYLEPNLNDTNWERSKRELAEGRIGMMVTGNWAVKQIVENGAKPEDLGFFPFPYDNSGKPRVTLYPDRYYAVGKNSKHQAAAKAFIKWMVEESGYENYSGFIPVLKGRKGDLPQLQELDAYKPEYVEVVKDTDKLSQILNKAQLEMPALVQEYLIGHSQAVLDKYNRQWEQARKSLNISP